MCMYMPLSSLDCGISSTLLSANLASTAIRKDSFCFRMDDVYDRQLLSYQYSHYAMMEVGAKFADVG